MLLFQKGFVILPIVIGILAVLVAGGGYIYFNQQKLADIQNFDSCAGAGFPVMESYPAQCKTPDGRFFTEVIDQVIKLPETAPVFSSPTATPSVTPKQKSSVTPTTLPNSTPTPTPAFKVASPTLQPQQCKNSCGDGICQRPICLDDDCPCPETTLNCIQDCRMTLTY